MNFQIHSRNHLDKGTMILAVQKPPSSCLPDFSPPRVNTVVPSDGIHPCGLLLPSIQMELYSTYSVYAWFLSLSITFVRFTHVVTLRCGADILTGHFSTLGLPTPRF